MGYGLEGRVRFQAGKEIFLFCAVFLPALEFIQPQSFIQWVLGALSHEVKRPGCEVYRSGSYTVEEKIGGAVPLFHIRLHGILHNRLINYVHG
jgi:hypothetical protein